MMNRFRFNHPIFNFWLLNIRTPQHTQYVSFALLGGQVTLISSVLPTSTMFLL